MDDGSFLCPGRDGDVVEEIVHGRDDQSPAAVSTVPARCCDARVLKLPQCLRDRVRVRPRWGGVDEREECAPVRPGAFFYGKVRVAPACGLSLISYGGRSRRVFSLPVG